MTFSTAISGINAANSDLGVISNNIANASTTGFKQSRAEFADVYASSLLGAGDNAVGKGVSLSAVAQEFAQGNITFTNNSLDLAINGAGFFQISNEGSLEYTRAGSFSVDREGFLVTSAGGKLQGFQVDSLGAITGNTGDIQIDRSLIDPNQTSLVELTTNLDSRETVPVSAPALQDQANGTAAGFGGSAAVPGPPAVPASPPGFDPFADPPRAPDPDDFTATTSTTIFDSLGNPHVLSLYYARAADNTYDVTATIDGQTVQLDTTGDGAGDTAVETLSFTSDGQFDTTVPSPTSLAIVDWTPVDAAGFPNGAAVQPLNVDLGQTTQFGADFAVSSVVQDGFAAGQLRGLEIDETGIAFARYTNGESRALGQVALASFNNQNGLQPVGDTNWVETFASGSPNVGEPGTSGLGAVQSAALEDSNVEVTQALVDLIVAQRNFQANAQVIQTNDAITQTVINLR